MLCFRNRHPFIVKRMLSVKSISRQCSARHAAQVPNRAWNGLRATLLHQAADQQNGQLPHRFTEPFHTGNITSGKRRIHIRSYRIIGLFLNSHLTGFYRLGLLNSRLLSINTSKQSQHESAKRQDIQTLSLRPEF